MAIPKRLPIVVTLVLLGPLLSLSWWPPATPVSATWTYPSGFDPHGGYVDQWIWVTGGGSGYSPVAQLLVGEVDGIGFSIDIDYFTELEADPNITVSFEESLTWTSLVLHCQRFPTNITGYRRALALALDKNLVCEEAEGGLTEPMDGAIPISLPELTYEYQMTEHFYHKDIAKANASLEAAGFRDLDGDGWREYDTNNNSIWDAGIDIDDGGPVYHLNVPGCHIQLLTIADYQPAIATTSIMQAGMAECGLRGSIEPRIFDDMFLNYVMAGQYNLAICGWPFDSTGNPVTLYDLFHSEGPWNVNSLRYNNSEYDSQVEAMMLATTHEEAKQWAWNCSKILLEDMPQISCYNQVVRHAYRTDRWTGYVEMSRVGVLDENPWTPTSIRLHDGVGGPFGCYPTRYHCLLREDLSVTNVLGTDKVEHHIVFGMMYNSLWELDPIILDPSPSIARNWTIEKTSTSGEIQEGQKFTFNLFENITWHDGTPLTSADVAYSLGTLWPNSPYSRGRKVENIYHIDTPDDFTVIIYSNVSGRFEFIEATSPVILPKHIWEQHQDPSGDFFTWVPEPQSDFTGSGPYKWVNRIPGEYMVLERNPDWVFAVEHPTRPLCALNPIPLGLIGFSITVITIVVMIGVYYFYRQERRSSSH